MTAQPGTPFSFGSGGDVEHWDGSNLKERVVEEMADVLAAAEFFIEHNSLNQRAVVSRRAAKRAMFEEWHASDVEPEAAS